jgi:two-component system chemotaxis response regulator CheY
MHSILAVDDSASMRKMVSFTLSSAGYRVTEAVDGQDALEKAQSQSFDLVLTDQNMPRLDGLGLTKKLRETAAFAKTPILILTTESSDQMKQAGRAAGATGWLVKPFDPNRLIEIIQKVIKSTFNLNCFLPGGRNGCNHARKPRRRRFD